MTNANMIKKRMFGEVLAAITTPGTAAFAGKTDTCADSKVISWPSGWRTFGVSVHCPAEGGAHWNVGVIGAWASSATV
jgi:hypothetical protein